MHIQMRCPFLSSSLPKVFVAEHRQAETAYSLMLLRCSMTAIECNHDVHMECRHRVKSLASTRWEDAPGFEFTAGQCQFEPPHLQEG